MNELTRLIRNDCKPSLGVTEPGAIALAGGSGKEADARYGAGNPSRAQLRDV